MVERVMVTLRLTCRTFYVDVRVLAPFGAAIEELLDSLPDTSRHGSSPA
jgi:hypothetical protein